MEGPRLEGPKLEGALSGLQPRAAAMAERITHSAKRMGIDDAGIARVIAAYALAMQVRDRVLEDEEAIDYLHPGRVILILLEDLGIRDTILLASGALIESRQPELRTVGTALGTTVQGGEIQEDDEAHGDDEVLALAAMVPTPLGAGERLLEELVIADQGTRVLALAEWLDQVRRLHLRDREEWESDHQLTEAVYLPIAERTDGLLARRFRWWCRIFRERYLER